MGMAKWIQALMLIFATCFICIFVFIFINNDQISMFKKRTRSSALSSSGSYGSQSNQVPAHHGHVDTDDPEVLVSTKFGKVRGFSQNVFGTPVATFLGIPYATPPVGSLRFKRTVPPMPWTSHPLSAKQFRPKCAQLEKHVPSFTDVSAGMSEDCLYLNIWSSNLGANQTELKPVLMWIYGGGFFMGTSNFDETDGRVLAALEDVVVVTFDYRVGALGFLDLGTDSEAGNQGLYDQLAAMRWVRDNIEYFGGNGSQITLVGESSGGIAIGLHMMSPEGSRLFSRAIMQSGSPMMTNAFFTRAERSTSDFVTALGCLVNDPMEEDLAYNIECLRKKPLAAILNVTAELHGKYFFAFPPTGDNDYLPQLPTELTKDNEGKAEALANVKEILIGTDRKGFSFMLHLANPKIFARDRVTRKFNSMQDLRELMSKDIGHLLNLPPFQIHYFTQRLFANYTEDQSNEQWLDRLIEVLGDMSFNCPTNIFADELAMLGKQVYIYEFTQQSKGSPWGEWFGPTLHDDIPFVFGHPLRYPHRYSGRDLELSKRMMRTWAEFARTGKPPDQLGVEWQPHTVEEPNYIQLNSLNATGGQRLHEDTCEMFKLGFDLLN